MNRIDRNKRLIAHRGASAAAPENTLPAFELGLAQGADTLEHDLQVTNDGVLICLHDLTLERTTNVSEVFPDRARCVLVDGRPKNKWFAYDFTLDEIKRLDAGAWFDPAFAGTTVPTFQELIDAVGRRGAILTELKDCAVYRERGVNPLDLFASAVDRHGLGRRQPRGPFLTVQSFDELTVRHAIARLGERLPVVFLIEPFDMPGWSSSDRLAAIREFAVGIGPGKAALEVEPDLAHRAHACGLSVTPWTFSADAPGRFATVRAQMAHYLTTLDVDGVITNNPDQCPRELL